MMPCQRLRWVMKCVFKSSNARHWELNVYVYLPLSLSPTWSIPLSQRWCFPKNIHLKFVIHFKAPLRNDFLASSRECCLLGDYYLINTTCRLHSDDLRVNSSTIESTMGGITNNISHSPSPLRPSRIWINSGISTMEAIPSHSLTITFNCHVTVALSFVRINKVDAKAWNCIFIGVVLFVVLVASLIVVVAINISHTIQVFLFGRGVNELLKLIFVM